MCGFMVNVFGKIVEILVKFNFCEGLLVLEYFIFLYGVRKGFVDIVICIVEFGYLIRRFVDVS